MAQPNWRGDHETTYNDASALANVTRPAMHVIDNPRPIVASLHPVEQRIELVSRAMGPMALLAAVVALSWSVLAAFA